MNWTVASPITHSGDALSTYVPEPTRHSCLTSSSSASSTSALLTSTQSFTRSSPMTTSMVSISIHGASDSDGNSQSIPTDASYSMRDSPSRHLPDEMIHLVMSCLDVPQLAAAACVNRQWNQLHDADEFWRPLYKQWYGDELRLDESQGWKRNFASRDHMLSNVSTTISYLAHPDRNMRVESVDFLRSHCEFLKFLLERPESQLHSDAEAEMNQQRVFPTPPNQAPPLPYFQLSHMYSSPPTPYLFARASKFGISASNSLELRHAQHIIKDALVNQGWRRLFQHLYQGQTTNVNINERTTHSSPASSTPQTTHTSPVHAAATAPTQNNDAAAQQRVVSPQSFSPVLAGNNHPTTATATTTSSHQTYQPYQPGSSQPLHSPKPSYSSRASNSFPFPAAAITTTGNGNSPMTHSPSTDDLMDEVDSTSTTPSPPPSPRIIETAASSSSSGLFGPSSAAISNVDQLKLIEWGAVLVAWTEYPWLSFDSISEQLDGIAALVDERMQALRNERAMESGMGLSELPPLRLIDKLHCLHHVLYSTLHFCGNESNYYDVRNSFIQFVLYNRTGIPISLAIVYMAVALRMGIQVQGVNSPGHFLLRVQEGTMKSSAHGATGSSVPDCASSTASGASSREEMMRSQSSSPSMGTSASIPTHVSSSTTSSSTAGLPTSTSMSASPTPISSQGTTDEEVFYIDAFSGHMMSPAVTLNFVALFNGANAVEPNSNLQTCSHAALFVRMYRNLMNLYQNPAYYRTKIPSALQAQMDSTQATAYAQYEMEAYLHHCASQILQLMRLTGENAPDVLTSMFIERFRYAGGMS